MTLRSLHHSREAALRTLARTGWGLAVALTLALLAIVEVRAQAVQPGPGARPGVSPEVWPEVWNVPGDGLDLPAVPAGPRPIALIVPLTGRQQALGRAVRDGFLAAHLAAGSPANVSFVVLDEVQGAANALAAALEAGAGMVVGPLLKESVQALAAFGPGLPTLALNYLPEGSLAPPAFYQFGLAPEDETREVALRALALGQRRALALVPSNEWGRRLLASFQREFEAGGGMLLAWQFYEPGSVDYSQPIQSLLAAAPAMTPAPPNPSEGTGMPAGRMPGADLLFLAANSSAARQIRPQLIFFGAGQLPVYSTASVHEDGATDADLNGIQFPDTPWTLAPDAQGRAVKDALARFGPPGALGVSRLYALGFDAYALAPRVRDGGMGSLALAGATGQLSTTWDGRVLRRLPWAEIRGGVLRNLPPVPLNLSPALPASSSGMAPNPDLNRGPVPGMP